MRNNLLSVWYKTGAAGSAVADAALNMALPAGDSDHKFNDYLK